MRNIKGLLISLLPFGLKSDDWMTCETQRITEFLETPMDIAALARKSHWEFNQAWNQVRLPNGLMDILTPDELTTQYSQWRTQPVQSEPVTFGQLEQSWRQARDQSGQQRQYIQSAIHNIGDFASVSNAHHGSTNLSPAGGTSSGYSRVTDERVFIPANSTVTVQPSEFVSSDRMYFITNAGISERISLSDSGVDANSISTVDGPTWTTSRSR